MFEQTFKNIDDVLWKEAGCTTALDYTEQTSWLLFLKYLDGLEQDRATEAELAARKHQVILDEPYRWSRWAVPKGKNGQLDHNKALVGDDLRDFVNLRLFPYLHVDELRFSSQTEKCELSHLYVAKIQRMGNAGRNGGEYYTPRPLIRAIVQVVRPRIGERIYDGACDSAGF